MKRSNKKGFTIVELVIVIAIIAILAAVLIPTFASLIQKANESKDTQLVKNLNTALAADTNEHNTMQDALDAAAAFGYDVGKINASATGNEILWDSENDVFCYRKGENVEYIPETNLKSGSKPADYKLWKIYGEKDEIPSTQKYSIYWNKTDANVPTLTVGFDAGTNSTITALTYSGDNSVVICTNSTNTALTVKKGNVAHYGKAGKLTVSGGTYDEYGSVGSANVTAGTLNAKAGSFITLVQVASGATLKADSSSDVKLAIGSGTFDGVTAAEVDGNVTEETTALVKNADGKYKADTTNAWNNAEVLLLKEVNNTVTISGDTTVVGNLVPLNAKISGSGTVTLKNISSKGVTLDKGFSGTLTFDGGLLEGNKKTQINDKDDSDTEASFYSLTNNSNANLVFKNLTIKTGTLKGIKVKYAKSVVIENCVFEATKLQAESGEQTVYNQSLSAIDIQSYNEDMSVEIRGCTFKGVPYGTGYDKAPYDTAGAIKIKSEKPGSFAKVVIENNTFVDCCRDIVIGTAKATDSTYTKDSNFMTIQNNKSTLTADSIKEVNVKTNSDGTTTHPTKIGEMKGGCAVFDVAKYWSGNSAS